VALPEPPSVADDRVVMANGASPRQEGRDQAFAGWLYADQRAKNLPCLFAPEDVKIGDRFQERIEESIRFFDTVINVLSTASVGSLWVEREVNAARERENPSVLFPIRIES
jgi:hypothetical protein